jgi:hypothetical protein
VVLLFNDQPAAVLNCTAASLAAHGPRLQVRPLNDRERNEGFRNCISLDEATRQVVLAVSVSFPNLKQHRTLVMLVLHNDHQ